MEHQVALRVRQKCVSVVVKADAFDLSGHRGMVDLNADDADKLSPVMNRDIVGNDLDVEVVRNVRMQPYGIARVFGNREPDQFRRVCRVVLGDVRNLVLDKIRPVQVCEPEALDLVGNARVNPVVIGQHTVGLVRDFVEIFADPLGMLFKVFVVQAVQIPFGKGGYLPHGFLDAVEIIIQVPFPCFA